MIFKACAIALITVFVAAVLKELGFRSIGAISAICGAVILSLASNLISDSVGMINEISEISGIADAAKDVLKIIGVGYIFGFCVDLGDNGTSSALTLFGRLEVLGIALPYFKNIVDMGISLIK